MHSADAPPATNGSWSMPLAPITGVDHIDAALAVLRVGGVVVIPTDTVYGVAVLPGNERAARRLFRAKRREPESGLPVLIADESDLARVAAATPIAARRMARVFWPGPLTLVLRRAPAFRGGVADGDETVAVRIPAHEPLRALLRAAGGALLVAGANPTGRPAVCSAAEAARQVGRAVDLILDGGDCPEGAISSIVDCSRARPRLLRQGTISRDDLTRAALTRIG